MARMKIIFSGFTDLAYEIDKAGGDLHAAVDEALTKTGQFVQNNVSQAALPYAHGGLKGYADGDMFHSLKSDHPIIWKGTVAEVSVGFNLYDKGGYHSIFVMYGTPRISKDQKLYNSIKGTRTKHAIALLQEEVMKKHLALAKGEGNG